MVGSQIRNDSGGIKVKVFLYNPLVNFLKLNTPPARKLFFWSSNLPLHMWIYRVSKKKRPLAEFVKCDHFLPVCLMFLKSYGSNWQMPSQIWLLLSKISSFLFFYDSKSTFKLHFVRSFLRDFISMML